MTTHACACFNIQTRTHTRTANWLRVHKWVCIFRRFGKLGTHTHAHAYAKHTHTHTHSRDTHTHTHSDSIVVVQGAVSSSSNLFVCFFFILFSTFSGLAAFPPHPSPQTYLCTTPSLGHSNNYACHSFMCMHTDAHAPTHCALPAALTLSADCSVDCSAA